MSDKGDVYYCGWKKIENGNYAGWLKRRPSLRVEAADLEEMAERLAEEISEAFDDQEAALEFDPSFKLKSRNPSLFCDGIATLNWNSRFSFNRSTGNVFVGGNCLKCGGGLGARGPEPLVIDDLHSGSDGAFSIGLMIVSGAFLKLLNRVERSTFEARPVQWAHACRRRFFEVIPRAFVPKVAIKGYKLDGWRCGVCKRTFYSHVELGLCVDAVCRSDLPKDIPGLFFTGDSADFGFCISRARWEQLRGKPGSRKLLSNPVAIIGENKCVRRPTLLPR